MQVFAYIALRTCYTCTCRHVAHKLYAICYFCMCHRSKIKRDKVGEVFMKGLNVVKLVYTIHVEMWMDIQV